MNFAWKQVLVTFAIALVIGFALGRWQFQSCAQKRWDRHQNKQEWILKKLSSKLNLSTEQRSKVQAILEETRPQMIALREEMFPKFDAIRKSVNQKIRPILNPDQQGKFDQMEARWEERRRQAFSE